MWRNYWTVAIRALAKSKTYSVINIAGLAIGMAACILILLYLRYERSYENWLPDVANTYQFQTHFKSDEGEEFDMQMASYTTKERIEKDFPQVENAAYILGTEPVFLKDGQASATEDWKYADEDFLKVVNLPLVAGTTLTAPQTAVLTRTEAMRRFGTEDVVGRTFTIISVGKKVDFKVSGIIEDLPKNSHMRINAILRRDFPTFFADNPQFLTCWGCQSGWVYAKLKPGTDAEQLNAQLPAWEKRNIPDEDIGTGKPYNPGDDQDWRFTNVSDVHLGAAQDGEMAPGNDRRTITTFTIIAILILGMAVVNFTNLATARASQRAREVALRKVLGANRRQLIVQFVSESVLIAAASMLIALALVELLVRPFAAFLDADLQLSYLGSNGILLPAIGLTLLVGVLSGLYPAFFLSRFQPAQVLKANRSAAETPGSGRLRTALVVLQFAVSIGLIICTAVVYGQTVYARSVDPGYNRDNILQVDEMARAQLIPMGETIVERMKRVPGVKAVGRTDIGVATDNNNNTFIIPPGTNNNVSIGQYNVDEGFFDAMGLRLKAGRWFDPNRPMDDMTLTFPPKIEEEKALAARGINVVMNEFAVKKLGFKSPQDAVGKTVRSELFQEGTGMVNINIIGVVADSRFRSVRTPIDPIMFRNANLGQSHMIIRYDGEPAQVRAAVEAEWKKITNEVPFNADFSEDVMAELYEAEDARAQIFAGFSLLAVIIGCLGLFGLAAFTAERRTKEIGIRKVLGARTRDIVQLLVWQFSRPVIVANLIAWPVAWWMMRDWLNGFDQRITLGPGPFLIAALVALAIAVGTVMGHAIRVARANPIHALRYE
ncbi:ABC transporter permease [Sphingomonas lutea]|uniref:ABC transporter permease n=2 Tax=Sphingomonas lutea TaxID=1045317 RepID=A0A7G9SLB1_9SPHN|nr:ABC transporter permease [Sphingomonas lutea]